MSGSIEDSLRDRLVKAVSDVHDVVLDNEEDFEYFEDHVTVDDDVEAVLITLRETMTYEEVDDLLLTVMNEMWDGE
jgi:hypothetical protein